MKNNPLLTFSLLFAVLLSLGSCAPIILSPTPHQPPPAWFYPGRLELVRYVYFPDYFIYYDLATRNYLYLENNVWMRVHVLPERFRSINFNRSRFVRVRGYRDDAIRNYHRSNYPNSPRSSRSNRPRGRSN